MSLLAERLRNGALVSGGACLALAALWWWVEDRRALGMGTLGAAAALTLWSASEAYVPLPRELATTTPGIVEELQRRVGGQLLGNARTYSDVRSLRVPESGEFSQDVLAIAAGTSALLPDADAIWGIESANWYLPAITERSTNLLKDPVRWRRLAGLANVRFIAVDDAAVRAGKPAANLVAHQALFGVAIVENPSAVPRAYLAAPRCVDGPEASLAALTAPDFLPGRQVVVECTEPLAPMEAGAPLGEVRMLEYAANRVLLEVDARAPAALVLTDAFSSGWSATVDGSPVPILAANHAFRAVMVPQGAHRVGFFYRPPGFSLGLVFTGLGVALCLGAWALRLRRGVVAAAPGASAEGAAPG
jgi:hypothetical protein